MFKRSDYHTPKTREEKIKLLKKSMVNDQYLKIFNEKESGIDRIPKDLNLKIELKI